MPEMEYQRCRHSSCALGSKVYVFCGSIDNFMYTNTIEVLDQRRLSEGWRCLEFLEDQLWALQYPLTVPRSENKTILIMGGIDGDQAVADIVIFDIKTETCTKQP